MSEISSKRKARGGFGFLVVLVLAAAAGAFYYTYADGDQPPQQAPVAPPPPVAEFITLQPQPVRTWTRFSGRLSAVDVAEIKALVGGELQQVLFDDGQQVEKDALLFVIDPRPYKAAVNSAQARLASAQSRAKLAKDELQRVERLVKDKLVSESVFDSARNEYQVANAAISEAQSTLAQAKLDLDYCYIRAPFSGRLSRAELTVGNIVETMPSSPVLTTIVANDKLYAEFDVDEQTYIKTLRVSNELETMPVQMTLAADESVVYRGKIHSFDNQLDTSSGTIRARAIFDNTDGVLTPGMYANVQLGAAVEELALLVPSRAIGTNQAKKFVLVIDADNKAAYREVLLGDYHDGQRVVVSGLVAGDRVVVNGLAHIRPNSPVTPVAVADIQATDNTD